MVYWLAILVGGLFVWLAVRLGLFQTWSLLFSVAVSIYLAIFLAPRIAEFAPATGMICAYHMALSMAVVAGACFALLYGASYVFLTAQFKVSFPAILDILLSGVVGFITGFLILSFVALVIATTPLVENDMVKTMGLTAESQQANIAWVAGCCDRVHYFVATSESIDGAGRAAIERILDLASPPDRDANRPTEDANGVDPPADS